MKDPQRISQGNIITLIDINTGKTVRYVIWDIVVDAETGAWKMDLKTPHPENRVDYVLKIEAVDTPKKTRTVKTPKKSKGYEEEQ